MTAPRDLRAQLVETATRHWAAHGAAGFSVARIAKELGVSTASPYRHFADRDDLLVAVVARAADALAVEVTDAVDAAWPQPVDRLRAAAATWVRRTRATRIGLAEFALPEVARADPGLRATCRRPVDLVGGLVAAAVDPDADADPVVRDVLAVLHGFATVPVPAVEVPDGGDLAKAAADVVIRLLPPARRTRREATDPAPADDQPSLF